MLREGAGARTRNLGAPQVVAMAWCATPITRRSPLVVPENSNPSAPLLKPAAMRSRLSLPYASMTSLKLSAAAGGHSDASLCSPSLGCAWTLEWGRPEHPWIPTTTLV